MSIPWPRALQYAVICGKRGPSYRVACNRPTGPVQPLPIDCGRRCLQSTLSDVSARSATRGHDAPHMSPPACPSLRIPVFARNALPRQTLDSEGSPLLAVAASSFTDKRSDDTIKYFPYPHPAHTRQILHRELPSQKRRMQPQVPNTRPFVIPPCCFCICGWHPW